MSFITFYSATPFSSAPGQGSGREDKQLRPLLFPHTFGSALLSLQSLAIIHQDSLIAYRVQDAVLNALPGTSQGRP